MPWRIEISLPAARQLDKLDVQHRKRILKYVQERLGKLDDPRSIGKALQGPRFGELWKYRVGDYRLICQIEDAALIVLVLRIGNRKNIYR
ncbi:MAG: type II toxin-antitoxin system RelE/ParE family toxin [Candidatus Acidiferrales bacterium]